MRLDLYESSRQSYVVKLKYALGPLWLSLVIFLASLALLSTFRFAFSIWQIERVSTWSNFQHIMLNGLRVDISSLCYLFLIAILCSLLTFISCRLQKITQYFLLIYYGLSVCLLVYLEVITPTFILEYDLRPNRLLVEYLVYPKEVFSMLWVGYKFEIFVSILSILLAVYLCKFLLKNSWLPVSKLSLSARILVSLSVLVVIFAGARSSLGHRPLNPAMVSFSTDHLLNDLTLNSSYSVAFALKQMSLENSSSKYYGKMPEKRVIEIVRKATNSSQHVFNDDNFPSRAKRIASYTGKPKNLVILLQESLGARYVGGLGGLPLTPNLDQLMNQGWNFTNLYATGTRSVRGIEAIITGFTPTPSRSVVKLDKSQRNFYTIAKLLSENNYTTQFIYGGESHFDNMRSFFLGNGFNDIVDIDNFKNVEFTGSWGASDEDLYNQAHLEFEQLNKQSKPFFSLVFTSSNHSPFEYPEGKITPYDLKKNTRNNAAKYADYALGQFIQKAKSSSYWDDTVFMVIADHDSRVAGASLVPIEHFRIPGVILGVGIEPREDDRLVSQIDIAPTLLSLIGISGTTPMLGHDLTKHVPEEKQRVMMQYDKNFAYMTKDSVVILQPQKKPKAFTYENSQLIETEINQFMGERAQAHVLFGSLAYQNQWFQ